MPASVTAELPLSESVSMSVARPVASARVHVIAPLPLAPPGRLAFAPCPGRDQPLREAVAAIVADGFDLVLGLVGPAEFPDQAAFEAALHGRGIATLRLPIKDFGTVSEARWAAVAPQLHAALDAGRALLIHCLAGKGRSGTIAARLLAERELEPAAAISAVRAARAGAIETAAQEAFVAEAARRA